VHGDLARRLEPRRVGHVAHLELRGAGLAAVRSERRAEEGSPAAIDRCSSNDHAVEARFDRAGRDDRARRAHRRPEVDGDAVLRVARRDRLELYEPDVSVALDGREVIARHGPVVAGEAKVERAAPRRSELGGVDRERGTAAGAGGRFGDHGARLGGQHERQARRAGGAGAVVVVVGRDGVERRRPRVERHDAGLGIEAEAHRALREIRALVGRSLREPRRRARLEVNRVGAHGQGDPGAVPPALVGADVGRRRGVIRAARRDEPGEVERGARLRARRGGRYRDRHGHARYRRARGGDDAPRAEKATVAPARVAVDARGAVNVKAPRGADVTFHRTCAGDGGERGREEAKSKHRGDYRRARVARARAESDFDDFFRHLPRRTDEADGVRMTSKMADCHLARRRTARCAGARFLAAALALALVFAAPGARADSRTAFLISRLHADDFRVRTNAALALGATGDDAAVGPLCGAVSDSNNVVRQAAAAALRRLGKPAGLPCMRARLSVEPDGRVKLQLTRAISALESAGGGGSAPRVANAKFYVAVAVSNNTTGHAGSQILSAITSKLGSLGGYQIAPSRESPAAARSVIAHRNLKGYYLAVSASLSDTDRGLKALVRIAVFSYPNRDLRGEVAPYAIAPGVRRGDASTESSLLQAVAERAVEQFSQNFQ
jgi:hypothetical protein